MAENEVERRKVGGRERRMRKEEETDKYGKRN
jgi:hypothetical protein